VGITLMIVFLAWNVNRTIDRNDPGFKKKLGIAPQLFF
jgi:hypothetical protein